MTYIGRCSLFFVDPADVFADHTEKEQIDTRKKRHDHDDRREPGGRPTQDHLAIDGMDGDQGGHEDRQARSPSRHESEWSRTRTIRRARADTAPGASTCWFPPGAAPGRPEYRAAENRPTREGLADTCSALARPASRPPRDGTGARSHRHRAAQDAREVRKGAIEEMVGHPQQPRLGPSSSVARRRRHSRRNGHRETAASPPADPAGRHP